MGIIIAQIDMNSRNETCLNMFETTIARTPNYHTNQLKYAKTLPFIYAQIMATHSCLQNGSSLGFSVFPPAKNDVNRVSKRCLRHGMEPLQVVHELEHTHDTQLFHFTLVIGSVLLTHYTQHSITSCNSPKSKIKYREINRA